MKKRADYNGSILSKFFQVNRVKKAALIFGCLSLLAVPAFAGKAAPLPYTTQQISNNSAVSEGAPVLDNGQAVWIGVDAGCSTVPCKRDVYFYDGATVRNLTQGDQYGGGNPDIQSGRVAWIGTVQLPDGHWSAEIMFYDGNSIRQISDYDSYQLILLGAPSTALGAPSTHSGQAIWSQPVGVYGPDSDFPLTINGLFFFDGNTTRQVATNGPFYSGGFLNNGRIVTKVDNAVVLWENDTLTQITTDGTPLAFDGSNILISKSSGVYLWDGTSLRLVTTASGSHFDMDNGRVVWSGPDPRGTDYEIFLYDGVSVRQLTDNRVSDSNPYIHNGQVTWEVGSLDGSEIYVWNGTSTYRLTNNTTQDIVGGINNGQVVWTHATGQYGSDTEIFLATPK